MAIEVRDDLPVYTIGRVTALTGLSARQVRYYETKGLLQPCRTDGNQRLYSRDQIQILQLIKRLMDEGYSLANVQGLVREYMAKRSAPRTGHASRESFGRGQPVSLYPLVNRARLLEILDRLERRDRGSAGLSAASAPTPAPAGRRTPPPAASRRPSR